VNLKRRMMEYRPSYKISLLLKLSRISQFKSSSKITFKWSRVSCLSMKRNLKKVHLHLFNYKMHLDYQTSV